MTDEKPKGLRPITWAAILATVFGVATVALAIVSAMRSFEHSCEVCMTFRGQSICRTAAGRTAAEATRTATDNACGLIGARGMALSIECSNTSPDSVTCREGS